MAKKRKKGPEPQINKKKGIDPKDDHLFIDISELKFSSTKEGEFTNFLKNNEEYTTKIGKLFHEIIPNLHKLKFSTIERESSKYNFHKIKGDHLNLTMKILKNYDPSLKYSKEDLIQMSGGTGSIRLIGERSSNYFKLYFIDFHHLIYPSQGYNSLDYNKNRLCILNLK